VLGALVLAGCTPGIRLPEESRSTSGLLRPPPAPSVAIGADLRLVRAQIPFPFEENRGQAAPDVAFVLRAASVRAAFRPRVVSYTIFAGDPGDSGDPGDAIRAGTPTRRPRAPAGPVQAYTIEQELVGTRAVPPVGAQPAQARVNYLKGPSDQWLTDLPTFDQLVRADAWNGIDVVYERSEAGVKSTYEVAPGADPSQIRLAWHGAMVTLAEDGALHLETPLGTLQETAPVAWQERDGQRLPVAVRWAADRVDLGDATWGFWLGAYNPALPLVIDPTVLAYTTYIGGDQSDEADGIAVDSSGAVYIAGTTRSTEASFPNGGGFGAVGAPGLDQIHNGGNSDTFVAKLAPNGQSLIYATYIGGTFPEETKGIAVDSLGAAYVTGTTSSTQATFPSGSGFAALGVPGFNQIHQSSQDVFVVKVTPSGQGLAYATYLGGSGQDFGGAIAVDSTGAAYVTGATESTEATFPGGASLAALNVPGFDQTFNGVGDVFVVKLAPSGQTVSYVTYLGGASWDAGNAIAVDGNGVAYVAGRTSSTEATFPGGPGFAALGVPGFDQFFNAGISDAFVIKLAPTGQTLAYATYLGGSRYDTGLGVALDATGTAYVTGFTESNELSFPNGAGLAPLHVPGFDPSHNGDGPDCFVIKLAPSGQSLTYATYLGGNDDDYCNAIAVEGSGAAYVTGPTLSTQASFPNGGGLSALGVPGFDQTSNGGEDGFLVKLAPNGQTLVDATYLGGTGGTYDLGIALDSSGSAYIAGTTHSSETTFPNGGGLAGTGVHGFDQSHNGGFGDAFVIKLAPTPTPTFTLTPTSTPTSSPVAAACNPRPKVTVNAVAAGGGRLQVTVSSGTAPATPGNRLTQLTVTIPANARVDVQNGPQDVSGQQTLPVGDGTQPAVFFVRRVAPGAITVPLVASDTCGNWPSFVGGGANAF
jgi:hypothetical protein